MYKAKTKKKINSYVKMGITMFIGAMIGWGVGGAAAFSGQSVGELLQAAEQWIAGYIFPIMVTLAIAELLCCGVSYVKAEKIIKEFDLGKEEEWERLDYRFDVWSAIDLAASVVFMFLGMMLLGFLPAAEASVGKAVAVVPFLAVGIISSIFQIAAVKQTQRKDPMKKGDPAAINFQKELLKSMDEWEKTITYQAAYKTIEFMKIVLLVAMTIALLAHLTWSTGVAAVIFTGFPYLIMTVVYCIYSLKLQKTKINI